MGRVRAILCACVFLLAGCGGGGGGGDDPLALLEGTWFGPAHQGTVTLVIDGSGTVTLFLRDGSRHHLVARGYRPADAISPLIAALGSGPSTGEVCEPGQVC